MPRITKAELECKISHLERELKLKTKECEEAWDENVRMDEYISELENDLDEARYEKEDTIINMKEFIFRLKLENLYSNELKDFIEEYLTMYNF